MKSGRVLIPSLVLALSIALAGCGGSTSPGSPTTTQAKSKPTPTSAAFVSRTIPSTRVGAQLAWLLEAVRGAPLTQQAMSTHFDASFLAQVGATKLNSALVQLQSASRPALVGLFSQDPTALKALANFGGTELSVSISVDAAGLIDGLLLAPHLPPSPTSWDQLDAALTALAPNVGFLAAEVSADGTCAPIHAMNPSTARPLGSMFKLFVLGALAHEIAAGHAGWNQTLTVRDALKSVGSEAGSLQYRPAGSQVSVQQAATKMISISDNTAADMLINLVGRSGVESQVRMWSSRASLDNPFLTTRELFLLHYVNFPNLADEYLGLQPDRRAAFLASSVDPLALSQVRGSTDPRDVDNIEWFASPRDMCRAFAGLHQLSTQSGLAPIGAVLSVNQGGIGLDRAHWPTVWFKGGSEPGVLTLGYLAKNDKGQTFVVVAMAENPKAALPTSTTEQLLALAQGAFALVGTP
jgi:beta-lactamase class A